MTLSSVSEINKVFSSGSGTKERYGDICFWRLEVGRIERVNLLGIWTGAFLDVALIPPENSFEKSLKTAVSENSTGLKDRLLRKGFEDSLEVNFTLQHESRTRTRNTYVQEAKFWLDKASGVFSADDPHNPIVQKIQADYLGLQNSHTADDVRRAITNALHSFACVTLRDGGGVYWVPEAYAPQLRNLAAATSQIGHSAMYLIPVLKTAEAQEALSAVAAGSLEEDLRNLQDEISKFVDDPPARISTLTNRLEEYQALRQKASLYRLALGTTVQDLDDNIQKMEDTVQAMIENKEAERARR